MDRTSSKVSAQGKESLAGEQDARANLCRVTISSHRLSRENTFARALA